jgi:hypothetical protein
VRPVFNTHLQAINAKESWKELHNELGLEWLDLSNPRVKYIEM